MNKRNLIKMLSIMTLSLGLVAPALANETPTSLKGVTVVNASEVKKLQDAGAVIVDTRVSVEFTEKTIKGAKGIWYKEKSAKDINFDASQDSFDLSKLPVNKSTPLVFFCNGPDCWKSYKAAVLTAKAGYTKVNWFRNGMPEWVKAGLPTQ